MEIAAAGRPSISHERGAAERALTLDVADSAYG
jgi:hypothetical protein